MDGTWTIGELADHAATTLAAHDSPQANGRVRDLPNERLIRWYTTIGLLDPPLGRRGRTALYGRRHLLQLVAVKRRQAAGRSIAEIQVELAAATDETLERIAALPPSSSGESPPREGFWRHRPDISHRPATVPAALPGHHPPRPTVVQGVRLAPDLTLLLETTDLSDDDLNAIDSAARPLVEELRRRGLVAPPESATPPRRSQ
ncbi:helix-turn-helix domain-containing protein [Actinomadura algeriensis]|uniref:DNA-binding transcriptional MerR regulator n=1 Tax=Actinomadura algeriensis TaxID=1679523 RepID=A0ABR9JQS2_9ACTN|nr:MerR family transcriptional regulator [Actinomadura algeriensis]MBE1532916.1 DNA-binding transcriptional MerR regulator [Actinomadura algeriensis]